MLAVSGLGSSKIPISAVLSKIHWDITVTHMVYRLEFDITDDIKHGLARENSSASCHAQMQKTAWKHEFESFVASQSMYPELNCFYKAVKDASMYCWWCYAAKSPRMTAPVSSVVSVLIGSQPISLQCNFNKQTCSL